MGFLAGKLMQDTRVTDDGQASPAGRLYLRGEVVQVKEEFAHLLDLPARTGMKNKQAVPDATKTGGTPRANMKLPELRELAKRSGIPGYANMRKPELVEALADETANDQENA